MAWQTPKIDWKSSDTFNLNPDYARISGNIEYLQDYAETLYPAFALIPMGVYDINDFPQASFINNIVQNVSDLAENTFHPPNWGDMRTYAGNGPGWNEQDLNTIEGNMEILYTMLRGQWNVLPQLQFELGGAEF